MDYKNKKYDLIGEVSINHLTENRKIDQTSKYINVINLFHEIQKNWRINPGEKQIFEDKFELVAENEKILILMFDGNYLINLEDSKAFKDNNNEEIVLNNKLNTSQQILDEVKKSGIIFIIVYIPRAYENIEPSHSKLDNFESIQNQIDERTVNKIKDENEKLKESVNNIILNVK